jgi:hypothetical protein
MLIEASSGSSSQRKEAFKMNAALKPTTDF